MMMSDVYPRFLFRMGEGEAEKRSSLLGLTNRIGSARSIGYCESNDSIDWSG